MVDIFFSSFYHDISDVKKVTALLSVVNWFKSVVMHYNNNTFVFNQIVGYNTVCYDNINCKYT